MSGISAGSLRHWVALQRDIGGQNSETGEMFANWQTQAECFAEIVMQSAREFVAASAEQSEARGRMTIRFRDDVNPTWRVVYRGKYYAILGIMEDAESMLEHLTLVVGEGVRLEQ